MPLYEKAGSHPLIEEYNRLFHMCQSIERQIDEAEREDPRPEALYSSEVEFHNDGAFHILQRLENPEEFDRHLKTFGRSFVNPPQESRRSVEYYITSDDILTFRHGGAIVLDTPVLLTGEEASRIRNRILPLPQRLLERR